MLAMFTGFGEYVVIIGAILMMFGAKKVPEIARTVGRAIHEVRRASNEFRDQIMTADLSVDVDVPEDPHHGYDYDHDHASYDDHDHDHEHYHHPEDDHHGEDDPNAHYHDHGMEGTVSQGETLDVDTAMDVAEAAVGSMEPSEDSSSIASTDVEGEPGAAEPEKKADGEA